MAVAAKKMPAKVAPLRLSIVRGDHGLNALKPIPLPRASNSSENAPVTNAPASTAGQEIAEVGTVSFSTITVSTMATPYTHARTANGHTCQRFRAETVESRLTV